MTVLIGRRERRIEVGNDADGPPLGVGAIGPGPHGIELGRGAILVPRRKGVALGVDRLGRGAAGLAPGTARAIPGDDRPVTAERVDPDLRQARSA